LVEAIRDNWLVALGLVVLVTAAVAWWCTRR
jgi:hypothetical protein